MTKRIVITGLGVISPIGIGKDQYWQSLSEGNSGFKPISLFDTSDLKVKIAGEIANFNPKDILGSQNLMDLDRATLLLLCAAKLALKDSNLEINEANTQHIGVSVGTTFGSLYSISSFDRESLREGPQYVNPSIFPSTVANSPASRLNIKFGIKGFSSTISTGMCAGLDVLDYAIDQLNLNRVNTIVMGAVEDLSIQAFLGFYKLNYLSGMTNGIALSCPFDKRRNGIILSEGAVVMILEELSSALSRKATVYAEILGMGSCFDTARFYNYNPKGEGMINAMRLALENAKINPKDISCIFANANSTKEADLIETEAIKAVFEDAAYGIPITALKSIVGESYSVSGGFATLAGCLSLSNNLIPATINYKEKDKGCDLNYVVNQPLKKPLTNIMINAFGPNGANTTIIIKKVNNNQ
ncbi:MAG: beta-ketoacyl-[acyl-carrier-protein] synthase family protein [Candidatus Omnitrophica bacterium]|nr:beta-ketoacyl-[acyl-carrier-protein] synthase family protein [Candidatus Omnitrophota bacterium]